MNPDTKALKQLRKKSLRWPTDQGFFIFKNFLLQNLPSSSTVRLIRSLYNSPTDARGESKKFFHWCNKAYGAGKFLKSRRLLRTAIGLLGEVVPTAYSSLLDTAVKQTSREPDRRSSYSNSILHTTKEIRQETFDAYSWYQLSRGLFSLGYFRAAWVARENSLDLSITESLASDPSVTALQRGMEALFERRNYLEVEKFYTDVRNHGLFPDVRINLSLVQNYTNRLAVNPESPSSEALKKLDSLIRDKYVVVIGPACPSGEYGEEIDKADTVIRLKFTDGQKSSLSKFYGSRADILYFGGGQSMSAVRLLAEQGLFTNLFEEAKLILTNTSFSGQIRSVPVHVIQSAGKLYRTPSTSGLRTVMEVLKHKPQKLTIYGFDFYSTLTTYNQVLFEFYENSSWQFGHPNDFITDGIYMKFARARDFAEHDPVSNFCFAQNLYKAGLFEIEPYGKSILEITPYKYVERLEEMLGDW